MSSRTDATEIWTREKRYEKAFFAIIKNRSKPVAMQYGAFHSAKSIIPHPDMGFIITR